jgi:hypothetical protein
MNCHVTDIPFHFLLTVSRFLELGSTLEPGKPVKADKDAILSDATHGYSASFRSTAAERN